MLRRGLLDSILAIALLASPGSIAQAVTTNTPHEAQVRLSLIDVEEIDAAAQSFSASVAYFAQWHDPSQMGRRTDSTAAELAHVWNPQLFLVNQQQVWNNYPESVEITPHGDVTYHQKVWGKFSQPFDLHDFPLDRQTLVIQMANTLGVELKPTTLENGPPSGVASHFSLPDFEITSWQAGPISYSPMKGMSAMPGYEIRVEVKRLLSFYILKVLLPLCLIIAVSWIPRWIDPKYFAANIGLVSTAFLTLIAYILSINMLMPRMSYLTRMDRFVLMSIVFVFLSVLQTVASGMLYDRRPELAIRIEKGTRPLYPLGLALIFLGSFVLF